MRPWVIDAGIAEFSTDELRHFTPISNKAVRAFLSPQNSLKTVLVAPKGYGKTLLLKKKAADLRSQSRAQMHSRSLSIHPSDGATTVEFISINGLAQKVMDWNWASHFRNTQAWSDIWVYAIGFLVCRNEGRREGADKRAVQIADEIELVFGDGVLAKSERESRKAGGGWPSGRGSGFARGGQDNENFDAPNEIKTVRSFLSTMLLNWDTNGDVYSALYTNTVQRALENLQHTHILFLDSPDEAMNWDKDDKSIAVLNQDVADLWGVYPEHWVNFNIGLVDAIRKLRLLYGHIRVFTSIRAEAINSVSTAVAEQYEEICVRLHYSKAELRQIFESNILLMSESDEYREDLVNPGLSDNLIEDFIGIDRCLHEPTGMEEDVFDAIVRHTRGTPRDLMSMGSYIMDEVDVQSRKSCTPIALDPIRKAVDTVSQRFLRVHKASAIPHWSSGLDDVIAKFGTNIIHRSSLRIHAPLERRNSSSGCPFDYLYAQGLIGWIGAATAGTTTTIQFLDGKSLATTGVVLPEARWYALHPIFYGALRGIHGEPLANSGYLSSSRAIVGNGQEVTPPHVIDVVCNKAGGTIRLTGGRILKVDLNEGGMAATVLLTLVAHAVQEKTTIFELDGVTRTFAGLKKMGVPLREPRWSAILEDGVTDETKIINTQWLAKALCVPSAQKVQCPMRFRFEKPKLHLDGVEIAELRFEYIST